MRALDARQMRLFASAVSRRSAGVVCVCASGVPVAEARALWADLTTAFPRGAIDVVPVTEFEQARFQQYIARVSHGSIDPAGLPNLGREQMLALSAAAVRLVDWQSKYAVRGSRGAVASAAALAIMVSPLAACTTFLGGNIKGSFSCSAPNGSCAPSTVIDDQALSVIQNARPMTPAGPYYQPSGNQRPVVTAAAPVRDSGSLAVAGNGMIHRDRRVLRVVFPSFVDGQGNVHEPRVVNTVVDQGGWMEVSSGEPNAAAQAMGLSDAAAMAQADVGAAGFRPASQVAMTPVDARNWTAAPVNAGAGATALPDPAAVEAARRRANSTNPIDGIRSQVESKLGAALPPPAAMATAASKAPPAAPSAGAVVPAAAPSVSAAGTASPAAKPVVVNSPATFPAKVEE